MLKRWERAIVIVECLRKTIIVRGSIEFIVERKLHEVSIEKFLIEFEHIYFVSLALKHELIVKLMALMNENKITLERLPLNVFAHSPAAEFTVYRTRL